MTSKGDLSSKIDTNTLRPNHNRFLKTKKLFSGGKPEWNVSKFILSENRPSTMFGKMYRPKRKADRHRAGPHKGQPREWAVLHKETHDTGNHIFAFAEAVRIIRPILRLRLQRVMPGALEHLSGDAMWPINASGALAQWGIRSNCRLAEKSSLRQRGKKHPLPSQKKEPKKKTNKLGEQLSEPNKFAQY